MDIPATLLVTNDFPPRVGGIQRTLEALWRQLPSERVSVFCPRWEGDAAYDERAGFPVLRQPDRYFWPAPDLAKRVLAASREVDAEIILFGAISPVSMIGPRLARAGLPYMAAAHGFEYWACSAPGTHSLVRRATSSAARVPVLCSEFVARRVRAAVPRHVPVSVLYPGADIEVFRPDLPTEDRASATAWWTVR